ncbi:restriction endonuclease subunit S [Ruminococcus bicirculans (ex Wegman et al. 2014)]|uniref:restriction endonuclease subunit S n=1 Tax=Ruminococcus bicirculans (ex Wegman et al. 2014) TaxID=1160721 RepID=UPI00242F5009|nr:restriction endonuclease subunit S [Ruminococcus bicirculans (ex Wegman et al. 2014)]
MTAQQLKNSILQMAVQGKLVPQDPGDEPASVLLQRIKAEKQELIKTGKIKKDKKSSEIFRGATHNLPYAFCEQIGKEIRDISDELPFEIPDSWEWVRLGSICEIARGGSPRPIKQFLTDDPNGINWIKIGDSDKGGKYINETKEKIIPEGMSKSRFVHRGDFLLTNSMSFGRPYILNVDGCIHDGWLVLSGYQTAYDKDFLYYLLASSFAYYQFCEVVSGAVVKNLNSDKVACALFPLPPINEQHRIVAKIEELLPYIERYGKAEEHLTAINTTFPEALKKSILQEAVQGKLVPQDPDDEPASVLLERIRAEKQVLIKAGKIRKDKHESAIITRDKIPYEIIDGKERCLADEVPFEIPDSWCWCRLSNVSIIQEGAGIRTYQYRTSGTQILTVTNILEGSVDMKKATKYIATEEYLDKYQHLTLNIGDIVSSCSGASWGKTAIWDYGDTVMLNTSTLRLRFFNDTAYNMYLYWLTKTPLFKNQLIAQLSGMQPNFGYSHYSKVLIPLPPLAEQHRIVAKIEEIMPMIERLTQR